MDVLNTLDYVNQDFWKSNPNLLLIDEFEKFSKTENSSDVMWAISLIYHPESTFKNLQMKDREKLVKKKFNIKKLPEKIIKEFEKLTISPAKRQMIEWRRVLDEKTEFMSSLKYDKENWEMIEKMLQSNTSLFKEYQRISDLLEREGEEGVVKGEGMESASEKGLI